MMVSVPIDLHTPRIMQTARLAPQPDPAEAIEAVGRQHIARLRAAGVHVELASLMVGDLITSLRLNGESGA